jgi:hypothetical protein
MPAARRVVRSACAITALCLFLVGALPSDAASALSSAKTFRLGAPPVALAVARSGIWAVVETRSHDAQLWRLNARTGRRLTAFVIGPAGPDIGAVVVSGAGVWAAAGDHIVSVAASQPRRVRRIQLPGTISGLTVSSGSVWATSIGSQRNLLIRLDPTTLSTRARILIGGADAVASALGSVWVAGGGSLSRADPRTNQLHNVLPLSHPAADLAATPQRLWLLENTNVLALDHTGQVRRRFALPFAVGRLAVSTKRLWVIDNCGCPIGQLAALDRRSGRRVATWAVGATPVAVAATDDQVAVASFGNSTITLIAQ